jgi:peptide/nickel transport system substrate-binding protein
MRAGKTLAALAVAALLLAAGCGGSSGSGGGGGSSGAVQQGGIFTLGTTNYIDTLNPFNYIEAESVTAYLEVFPELIQLGPDLTTYEPSFASSWSHSADYKTYTFTVHSGGKWSDGKPLTSADVAWTANTIIKYQANAAAVLASAVAHMTRADDPNPTTVVFHYNAPIDPQLELSNLASLYVLPEHIWSKYTGNNGADLKSFNPENNLPLVSGGPFEITKYEKKGTTVFRPNPGWWGPKPHVDAVALVYYTNSDSMIADLKSGQIDAVDQVPYTAVNALKKSAGLIVAPYKYGEFTNITWNSNPLKPQNRELLNPEVKKALSMCVNRQEIINVIYAGNATPTNQSLLGPFAKSWQSPSDQTLSYNCAQANTMLDSLGYKKVNGVRMVPATTGKYAQAAHPMSYQVMVPDSLDFNGNREFTIVQQGWQQLGVKVTEQAGGDSSQAYSIEIASNCNAAKKTGYSKYDIALWDWFSYPDPDFQLSTPTTNQWCSWSDTGFSNPQYDQWYKQEGTLAGPARKAIVAKMDSYLSAQWIYTFLVDEKAIAAETSHVGGWQPQLTGYSYDYFNTVYKK